MNLTPNVAHALFMLDKANTAAKTAQFNLEEARKVWEAADVHYAAVCKSVATAERTLLETVRGTKA